MTAAQNRIFTAIKKFMDKTGHCPSYTEISHATGVNISTVHKHLKHLEQDGWLTFGKQRSRSIVLSLDKIAAGYSRCNRGHETIFFYEHDVCPMCRMIAATARDVSVEKTHALP
jgi:SOS-response transcriptional repressor LexA